MDRKDFRSTLDQAARQLEAIVREGPGDAWTVTGGTPACGNPNGAPWKAVVSLAGDAWGISPRAVSMPWNRRRASEIAAFRARQLDSLLRAPRTAEPHEKFPFAPGRSLAERAEAYAWIAAGGALAMALTLVAATLAGVPIIDRETGRLAQTAEVMTRLGADPVPRHAELDGLGLWGRLAAAFLLATPVAFFLGGLHAAVNAAGERFVSVARFAPWCLGFIGASSLFAFLPRMSWPLAIGGALLLPAAAALGTSLAWGRRRDASSLSAPPKRAFRPVILVAAVLIIALTAVLVPAPTNNKNRVHETSRFRDRFLLESPAGRALAHFYYAYTLYAAEPVKPAYSSDTRIKDRQVRTALLIGSFGNDIETLRALGFTLERAKDADAAAPLIAKRQHDIYIVAGNLTRPLAVLASHGLKSRTIRQGATAIPEAEGVQGLAAPATRENLQMALDRVLQLGGFESMLLELTWLGWTAVFYVGPLFVLMLASLPVAVGLVWLTRHRSPEAVRRVVIGFFTVSVAGLIAIFVLRSDTLSRVAALRSPPADDQKAIDLLASGLKDADPDVRYEAAYQSYMALLRSTFPRGGLTAELKAGAKDDSVRVRLWCAAALGLTRDPAVREDIFKALDDPDLLVRYRACEGLENLDSGRQPVSPETITRLRKVMQTRPWYEGMYALEALRNIEPLKY